jgi:hypothetical protein
MNYPQLNLEAAKALEERYGQPWEQLWLDEPWSKGNKDAYVDRTRPFRCVECGKPLSFHELVYSNVLSQKPNLLKATCYRCRIRLNAKELSRKEAA